MKKLVTLSGRKPAKGKPSKSRTTTRGISPAHKVVSRVIEIASASGTIVIPDEPIEAMFYPEDYSILLYGQPKIGKSTFASLFEDPLFISTEPGLKFLKARKVEVRDWPTYLAVVKMLESGKHSCGVLVLDTVDNAFKFCFDYICNKKGFEHPSDEEWGKGWEAVHDEFFRGIMRLANLGVGIIFVSHETKRDVVSRSLTITKTMPTLPKTGWRVIDPLVDLILYLGFDTVRDPKTKRFKERRVIITKPSENLEAGDRLARLPERMPLDINIFKKHFFAGREE